MLEQDNAPECYSNGTEQCLSGIIPFKYRPLHHIPSCPKSCPIPFMCNRSWSSGICAHAYCDNSSHTGQGPAVTSGC